MPSTFSTNLRLELIATGEQAGSWGNTTNTNLGTLIEAAISGTATHNTAGAVDTTLTANNGSADEARNAVIKLTGAVTGSHNVIVPSVSKLYMVNNATTGAFTITVKTAAGTGAIVTQGAHALLWCDGTNVIQIGNTSAIHESTSKATPVDADELALLDSAAATPYSRAKLTWANLKATFYATLGALIAAGTGKATPVDADSLVIADSAAANATKTLTWANVKATFYAALGGLIAAGTAKATPVAADSFAIADSAAANATKTVTIGSLAATATPLTDSTAGAVGTSLLFARQDHVHPWPVLTPQNVTASRALGVTYTNNTSNYIWVSVWSQTVPPGVITATLTVAGVVVDTHIIGISGAGTAGNVKVSGWVPPGATYSSNNNAGLQGWVELR